jgi:AcrR family transcriptional regulator
MLDAAESLFAAGGPDALTVEAVIETAGTSAGSFYARFGDRDGLFEALHERFIHRMKGLVEGVGAAGLAQPTLAAAVGVAVAGSLQLARQHRESLLFFIVHKATDERLRQQGIAANHAFAAVFRQVVLHHRQEIQHSNPEQAADVAFRMLFALIVQRVMFEPRDLTGRPMPEQAFVAEVSRSITLSLTTAAG